VPARECGAGRGVGDVRRRAGDVPHRRRDGVRILARCASRLCSRCGTQICFTADYIPGLIDITIGSLDEPARVPPALHYWDSERQPWVEFADHLPRYAEFPPTE